MDRLLLGFLMGFFLGAVLVFFGTDLDADLAVFLDFGAGFDAFFVMNLDKLIKGREGRTFNMILMNTVDLAAMYEVASCHSPLDASNSRFLNCPNTCGLFQTLDIDGQNTPSLPSSNISHY